MLLLFSASALTDTGSKPFDCVLVSTLFTCRAAGKGNYFSYFDYFKLFHSYPTIFVPEWLQSIGSQVIYELDPKNPIFYVLPSENILGKLPVVPVGDTGTVPHCLRNACRWAFGDSRPGDGKGCPMCLECGCKLVDNGMVPRYVMKSGETFQQSFGQSDD